MQSIEIELKSIIQLSQKVLISLGVGYNDAQLVVDSIIDAEMRGVESHGLMRLKPYVERIKKELVNTNPSIEVVKDRESIIVVDGDHGLGQVIADKTLDLCIDRLQTRSTIIAAVRNSNHFGTCGYYSRKAALKGYLAIVASNAGPTMAPWGGTTPLLGTNPIAVSFPVHDFDDFTLDMATSATAKGKIRTYESKSENIPIGWAIDEDGHDTTDPSSALGGTVLPLGAHKGYGLSMVVDVLCAGLSSASLSYEAESMTKSNRIANVGHFFMFVKISDLLSLDSFGKRMRDWFDGLKKSELRPGFKEILVPGEIENKKAKLNQEKININKKTYYELRELASNLGVI
jgi:LDH2 family malate/lactate/ureidoglycolate dehydrogenase